jgi:hypothetical protein
MWQMPGVARPMLAMPHANNAHGQPLPGKAFAGGQHFEMCFGHVVTANITP